MTGELTLNIDKTLIEKAAEYAGRRGLSLSRLVETYFAGLVPEGRRGPADEVKGVPGKALTRFAGTMDAQSVREIEEAVEAGCEQVDLSEW